MKKIIVFFVVFLIGGCQSLSVNGIGGWLSSDKISESLNEKGYVNLYINFKAGSYEINPESSGQLKEVAKALSDVDFNKKIILVLGHTSTEGSESYNEDLSFDRANEVVNRLIEVHGFDPKFLRWKGLGESQPLVSPEKNEDDRKVNRRVELRVEDKGNG